MVTVETYTPQSIKKTLSNERTRLSVLVGRR